MNFYKTKEEEKFAKECDTFKDYKDVNEYMNDAAICLTSYAPWHYTEEEAKERIQAFRKYAEQCFDDKVPANDFALDVGYTCG